MMLFHFKINILQLTEKEQETASQRYQYETRKIKGNRAKTNLHQHHSLYLSYLPILTNHQLYTTITMLSSQHILPCFMYLNWNSILRKDQTTSEYLFCNWSLLLGFHTHYFLSTPFPLHSRFFWHIQLSFPYKKLANDTQPYYFLLTNRDSL